jgi:hypothetical protein
MGYESRIYVVNRTEHKLPNGEKYVRGEEIARINLCVMSYEFVDLFDTWVDYPLFAEDGNTVIDTDKYGSKLETAPIQRVIDWLEERVAGGDRYRRITMLLGMLKSFDQSEWDYLEVVHYGY